MLRTTLLAAAILVTPVAAFASGGHHQTGYVAVAEPRIAVSIGGGQLNGFNLFYQSGGYPYAAAMPYYPAPVVIRPAYYPAPVMVQPAYYPAYRVQHQYAHDNRHGERRHDKHGKHHRD